jgi:hypothetical protein
MTLSVPRRGRIAVWPSGAALELVDVHLALAAPQAAPAALELVLVRAFGKRTTPVGGSSPPIRGVHRGVHAMRIGGTTGMPTRLPMRFPRFQACL